MVYLGGDSFDPDHLIPAKLNLKNPNRSFNQFHFQTIIAINGTSI